MLIQINLPSALNKRINVEKAELEMKTKEELIIHVLLNYYGLKVKVKK